MARVMPPNDMMFAIRPCEYITVIAKRILSGRVRIATSEEGR